MAQKHQKQSDSKKKLAEKSSTGARKISNLPAFTGHESGILVVGMGSSAGGLAALESFLDHMPARNRKAFVIVKHIEPTHKSMLSVKLQRDTKI
jgi:two-component system CheB/CheR fusion protein